MSACCHATHDNWPELERGYRAMLPEPILAFIDANRAQERSESMLIATLHMVQDHFGRLGPGHLEAVAQLMQIPLAKVTGVATFYHYFRLQPRGKYLINVCLGTACYVKGADKIMATLEQHAGIKAGETTADNKLSLLTARCIGACGIAPAVVYDGTVAAKQTPEAVLAQIQPWMT